MAEPTAPVHFVVPEPDAWVERRDRHHRRIDDLIGDYVGRRNRGENHPVLDFLFTYYSLKPAHLRRWSPGFGVVLTGPLAREYADSTGFTAEPHIPAGLRPSRSTGPGAVRVSDEFLERRRSTIEFVLALGEATASRPAALGCFGMHEWAMVYRSAEPPRHDVPLRLGAAGTDAVVESMPLRCSHFDAYRFFTPSAEPLNSRPLTRADQVSSEQPGCLHVNMDLYKWSAKLGPLVDAELRADCFELALLAREVDMRASPYDLADRGYAPIEVETAPGRAEYVRAQSDIARRAAPLRDRLSERCRSLLYVLDSRSLEIGSGTDE